MEWIWNTHEQALSVLFAFQGYSVALSTSQRELFLSCFSVCQVFPRVSGSQLVWKPIRFTQPGVSLLLFSSTGHRLDLQLNSRVLHELLVFVKEIFPYSLKGQTSAITGVNVFGWVAGENLKDSDSPCPWSAAILESFKSGKGVWAFTAPNPESGLDTTGKCIALILGVPTSLRIFGHKQC